MRIKIKAKIPSTKAKEDPVLAKSRKLLADLRQKRAAITAFREKRASIFEEYDELLGDEKSTVDAIRALLKDSVSKLTDGKRHVLLKDGGFVVTARPAVIYDAEKLLALQPKLLKMKVFGHTISADAIKRLQASENIDEATLKAITTHRYSILFDENKAQEDFDE